MKKTFATLLLVLSYFFVNAQWTNTTPDIHNTNSGNVGVGVAAPTVQLEVAGSGTSTIRIGASSLSNASAIQFNASSTYPFTAVNHNIWGGASDNALYINRPTGAHIHFRENNGTDQMTLESGGNVGIGVANPGAALEVKGNGTATIKIGASSLSNFGAIQFNAATFTSTNHNFFGGSDNTLYINRPTGGLIRFREANGTDQLTILSGGNVGIGMANPDQKLAVNGIIHSKEILVDLDGWSDYVFDKDYKLRPLNEVKSYIDQNHHLPDVPSAAEVEKSGLMIGEMNKTLMKKVEELTIYLIQQREETEKLKKEIQKLKKRKKQ